MDQQRRMENNDNNVHEAILETQPGTAARDISPSNGPAQNGNQFPSVHYSDSDVLINKSDSEDGLFITDSSDDVMNDVLSDFSPTKDRLEQTREMIMESLVQSFVTIIPDNSNTCDPNDRTTELRATNEDSAFDAIDIATVKKDMQNMHVMRSMRCIPSDSALPEFRRNVSDLASVAASDDYVTIGSASEEPTTASFFSQSASTSHLHSPRKPGSYIRSKSALLFRSIHRPVEPADQSPERDQQQSKSAAASCDTFSDHWLLNEGWLRKNKSDIDQNQQEALPGSGQEEKPAEGKCQANQCSTDKAQPTQSTTPNSEGKALDESSKAKQASKPQARNVNGKPTFKATKLPRFYRTRLEGKMASSRSESCVIMNNRCTDDANTTVRRSRSSSTKIPRPSIQKSAPAERQSKKDAGGVSYAVKHLLSPERVPVKPRSPPHKVRSPVRSCATARESSSLPHACVKASESNSYSKQAFVQNSGNKANEIEEKSKPQSKTKSVTDKKASDKVDYDLKADECVRNAESTPIPVNRDPIDASNLPQRSRPGSPKKAKNIASATALKTAKFHPENSTAKQTSDESSVPKRAATSSARVLPKRLTPAQRAGTPPSAGGAGATVSVSSGPLERSSVSAAPTLMSVKVDVSVRAEDGSVRSFRDISPPRDGRTGDLFSGVEELIRGLLEPTAAGGGGRRLTNTPVSVWSPHSGTPRSQGGGSDEPLTDRRPVPEARSVPVVTPRRGSEVSGGSSGRRDYAALDVHAQRCQAEESVVFLTSTGSMSSTDLWPQAARQIVYPSTTVPVVAATANRSRPGRIQTVCPSAPHPDAEINHRHGENSWQDQHDRQSTANHSAVPSATSERHRRYEHVSPGRSVPSAPPSSPVRVKHSSSSPDRGRTPSPRSRLPVPVRMVSESAVRSSRSPTPERHSFYQTAQTTPDRPRSATPDSLRSAGGSSVSLHSLKRSPRAAELSNFGTPSLSPRRSSPAVSDKRRGYGRSQSSSPRSARSSPLRHSPFNHLRCDPQQAPMSSVPATNVNELPATWGTTADDDSFCIKRHSRVVSPPPQVAGPQHLTTKPAEDSTTDIEPVTSSSGVHSQDTSSGDYGKTRRELETAVASASVPTPMKRAMSGPFVCEKDTLVQKPIPQKRTRNVSPMRPGTPHPRNEELMISSKTSFCSMDSPVRNRSPSPHGVQLGQQANEQDVTSSDRQNYSNLAKDDIILTSVNDEAINEKTELSHPGIHHPLKIDSPATENGRGSNLSCSISPRSARSNPSSHHSDDQAKGSNQSDHRTSRHEQHEQRVNLESSACDTGLEREMIETENTLKLMEETISVLERQNLSLASNTKEISEKIYQERARKCDLKTAKLMLLKVRTELQKTTKNSEENRMQLLSAKEKISEQESAIFLLKESLRDECVRNVRMERGLRERSTAGASCNATSHFSMGADGRDRTTSSLVAEPSSVRELLEETDMQLQEEKRARKDIEQKLAEEKSKKLKILNAAKKWRQQLEAGTNSTLLAPKCPVMDTKAAKFPKVSDSESSNMKSYQSIHTPGNSNESIKIDPTRCKSNESILSSHKFDIESASGSEYFSPEFTDKQDGSCQCEILDGSTNWKDTCAEMKQLNDLYLAKLSEAQHGQVELRRELQAAELKLKEETEKKDRFEEELKSLIDRIHEMQRDVQLYQRQSKEQLVTLRQGDHEKIECLEMEKLKLKDYYQQQMETIVQEKVAEFQRKVAHLETVVREQINTYTKTMQQKFREKLATASQQQKEVISRLEAEHSKELERLTTEYPQEIERLQQRLAEYQQEVIDKKNRLEQRETQVGTILRVVKLLIREGNAMKGDTKEQNTVEIARKILKCMDLNLDDIMSPRPCQSDYKEQSGDREWVTKDGSCVTFRSIPDSPRPTPANRSTLSRSAPPVPPRRRTLDECGQNATLVQKTSNDSTTTQPFSTSGVVKKISYTRFGDEVIRARSEEFLQNNIRTHTKQLSTTSDLSQWGVSGSYLLDTGPPTAPPPTPPSIATSSGANTEERDLASKESGQDVASSVLKELNHASQVKAVADKGTGSATSLIRDPSFLLLTNSILAEDAAQMCQCKRLTRALEEYGRLKMTIAHRNRLKEGPAARERTRSSSETSINRLASSYFESIEGGGIFETKVQGSSKIIVSSLSSSEHQSTKAKADSSKTTSKTSSDSNQLFSKDMKRTLAAKAVETGGLFANPFSMKPIPSRRASGTSEKVTSKPPIQSVSAAPSRSATGRSPSPLRQEQSAEGGAGANTTQPEATKSRSGQDASGFIERTLSPSRNVGSRIRKTSPTLKRMPSFDKVDTFDYKESSEDSKFALSRPPPPLELKPRDNRASVQRKQLAALRKQSPKEKERHRSISPRERKLFTLRNQQLAEKKITRTEVTKRTLSPSPVSPQAFFPDITAPEQTKNFVPTFKRQRDRSRSGRRSVSSGMDWKKYIKSGQPWQDVYLHEHNDPDYVEPIPTNGTYYTADTRNDDSDRSDWSPSYSWAPPRPGEREKWNRYLTTGQAAEQIALERFYATPERESADARRRMRRSRKQAEVMEHINRLLAVSSGSDPSEERAGRRAERGEHRSKGHPRHASEPAEHQHGRSAVLDGVRRKALAQLGTRHPADPLADLPAHRPPSERGAPQQRVSLSLDRDLPMPRRDCSVHQRLSADVKTHQRLAKEHSKQRRPAGARESSSSQLRWPADSRRKVPLVLVSRTPRGELAPPERRRHRSHSHSRHGTATAALDDLDMDSWVDQWERKWDHERRQRPLSHWPPT
ncbi:uncharacterized protein LOC122381505 [Amphibalanus amphitrite]|uniref:uncharacterized protein LOC122381505 n=1 Tax=Amphibalanus amphitrite TaxID=1232801 RepID=UPI001C90FF67|nr:uncharacterized protein LOC122381505 [Amphibalanus amphitrite]